MSSDQENLVASAEVLGKRYESNATGVKERPLIIFVLGAKAAPNMTPWKSSDVSQPSVQKMLLDWGKNRFGSIEAFADEIWEDFSHAIGPRPQPLDPKTFLELINPEIMCSVASKVHKWRRDVQDIIKNEFHKSTPILSYELVAHCIKHRFIDHVITLNFDPLLDDSAELEIRDSEYRLIFSDSQANLKDVSIPTIFKLHGTTNLPDTMKFAHDSTGGMYPEIASTLNGIIEMAREAGRPVYLYSYGYSWNDPDMVNWLKSCGSGLEKMYVILGSRTKEQFCKNLLLREADKKLDECICTITVGNLGLNKPSLNVGDVLWAQLELARGSYNDIYHVPISRHLIVSNFNSQLGAMPEAELVKERAKLEVALHVTKSKGMVTALNLANDHRLERQFQQLDEGGQAEIYDWLEERTKYEDDELRDVYYENNEDVWLDAFRTDRAYDFRDGQFTLVPGKEFYKKHLDEIRKRTDTEVGPVPHTSTSWIFTKAEKLPTFVALRSASDNMLSSTWSTLLTVSETTEWLTAYATSVSDKKISSITAKTSPKWAWGMSRASQISGNLGDSRLEMPWYRHNQHLTLIVDCEAEDSNSMQDFRGIYFRRAFKTKFINPVKVTGSDCAELLLMFITYTRRIVGWDDFEGEQLALVDQNIQRVWGRMESYESMLDERKRGDRIRDALKLLQEAMDKVEFNRQEFL